MTDLARVEYSITRAGPVIERDEPLPVALQRISVSLLNDVIVDLRGSEGTPQVHEARKGMKRLRGIIRLIRDQVGHEAYRNTNVVLRDTARRLSDARDAEVLVLTLDAIRERYGPYLRAGTFDRTERILTDRAARAARLDSGSLVDAITAVSTMRNTLARYPMALAVADEYRSLAPGIARVYRRGRRGFRRAMQTHDDADLHEWRKRVKYLRYQMEALTPLQPVLLAAQAHELDALGEILGVDHDLAVLSDFVIAEPAAARDESERWLLVALIHQRRAELQAQAARLGSALYAEKSKAFVRRIGAYWEAGHRADPVY